MGEEARAASCRSEPAGSGLPRCGYIQFRPSYLLQAVLELGLLLLVCMRRGINSLCKRGWSRAVQFSCLVCCQQLLGLLQLLQGLLDGGGCA